MASLQPPVTAVHVRTPATSANLGPGFDSLGLALDLHDELTVRWRGTPGLCVVAGGDVPEDETNLVVRAISRTFEMAGEPRPGLEVLCRNRIPHGRGLGSSASAIVAGVTAARALLAPDAASADSVERDLVFQLAADIEGHPDNVAPCVYGSFTIAWRGGDRWRCLRQEPSPDVRPVACVPEGGLLSTERARELLPEHVSHADAAFTAGRAALLTAAITQRPDLLFEATEDRLHEAYRSPAIPASAELVRALRHKGIPAVVSGAGPSVLAFSEASRGEGTGIGSQISADAVDSIREQAGTGWHIRPIRIDPVGVCASLPVH